MAGIPFLAVLLAAAAVFFAVPTPRLRQIVLAAGNATALAFWFSDVASFAMMIAFVASGFMVTRAVVARPPGAARSALQIGYIAALVLAFCILKRYQFLAVLLPLDRLGEWPIVGLSYMLFRQIHFLIDSAEGEIADATWWEYANYQLNLFTLTAGPIQRFQDFRESWQRLMPVHDGWNDAARTYCRLVLGALKVSCSGGILGITNGMMEHQLHIRQFADLLEFLVIFYGYPLYVYLNFSGYCDLVIAGASLFGVRLPENFNRPYLSRNMIDFWTRWHMTLTHWIRDYIFTPLLKGGLERFPGQAGILNNACFFIALFLAGIWHGSTWNFAIFGLLNGFGVALTKAWENFLIGRLGRKGFRAYLERRGIRVLMIVVTLHFVFFTFYFVPTNLGARLSFLYHLLDQPAPVMQPSP